MNSGDGVDVACVVCVDVVCVCGSVGVVIRGGVSVGVLSVLFVLLFMVMSSSSYCSCRS